MILPRFSPPYHHGHLREALVDAALAAARADGPEAVVLRAATRAAGVSPNAAYRHFADRDDLLRAVAARCQEQMAALMRARLAQARPGPGPGGAWDRLHTGLFAILTDVLDQLASSGAIAPQARPGAEYVAWSSVHGIATLLAGGTLRDLPAAEKEAAVERVINATAF